MKPLDTVMIDKILIQYDQQKKNYQDFLERTLTLIKEFIVPDGPKIHSIVGRIKEKESLVEKLNHPKSPYATLNDVPDIAGIRIITYFEEEVQVISEIIRREFNVFTSPEHPKSQTVDPNRFGYTSTNLQVGLLDNRLELIEYRRFRGFLVELQIRSVLQHAWLEINKHLGFQTREHCPPARQREYARVTALFELADLELNQIKPHAWKPPKQARAPELEPGDPLPPLPELPFDPPPPLEEDLQSSGKPPVAGKPALLERAVPSTRIGEAEMERFVLDNRLINAYDRKIADHYDTRLIFKSPSIAVLTEACLLVDIPSIAVAGEMIRHHEKFIRPVARVLFGDPASNKYEHISRGVTLLMVCTALAAKTGQTNAVFQFITRNHFENDPTITGLSSDLIDRVQEVLES
ncbi:hypothetical protein SIID45300_02646 [Candidatus Magnetaquicoccaceae bacterium FCR-1]|uniref:RelA/SpoT domain-containing protein n=1 Tax=Candidatus Magnetaquiglobus chichijimensis TaxID=3141448 RepID=A0ABQ0CBN4_9PROT